jgi:methionine salvage enolase-phosphatase E1
LKRENPSQVCVLPLALLPKAVLSISYVSDALFPSFAAKLKENVMFLKTANRKLWITLNIHKNKHPLINNTEG